MWSRVPRLVLASVVSASLATSLVACGDDDPATGPSDPSSNASTETGEPSGDPGEPSAEPATGPELESNNLRMRLFASPDWNVRTLGTLMGASLDSDDGLFEVRVSGIATTSEDLERDAEIAEENEAIERTSPQRVANRVIQGVELFVLEGEDDRYRSVVLGGFHNGYQVNIDIDFPADWPDADALIESMLASVEWK
ncbi:hypothetical protein [Nocardioides sp. Root190]|uniref:hypothetical protein n=1 Tax=Nocardioides sp. Root190 TaxID=1736488 RepID=UPI000A885085|nr:hypothetical protein [Nocardioides sp. Root190]